MSMGRRVVMRSDRQFDRWRFNVVGFHRSEHTGQGFQQPGLLLGVVYPIQQRLLALSDNVQHLPAFERLTGFQRWRQGPLLQMNQCIADTRFPDGIDLTDQVEIKVQDYRDERGSYDGIASIEMFEAVGEKYWPVYFNSLRDRLKPGAKATLQIITIADKRWEVYRKSVDFIQKYIFPGGMLPAPKVLRAEVEKAGLRVKGSIEFGKSYSQTLRRWHETFNARWDDVARVGFDERFRRMWNFYLTSCAGAFQGGNCDVTQVTVKRP